MNEKKVLEGRKLVFQLYDFTSEEIRECSLSDLLFCAVLRDLQLRLEPKKFRPLKLEERIKVQIRSHTK